MPSLRTGVQLKLEIAAILRAGTNLSLPIILADDENGVAIFLTEPFGFDPENVSAGSLPLVARGALEDAAFCLHVYDDRNSSSV